jgi:hypothetical protein
MGARRWKIGLAVVAFAVGFGQPALAGGGFNSSMTDWLPGNSSRSWNDSVADRNPTFISLDRCRRKANPNAGVTLRLQLTKETPFYQPDKNLGRRDFACHGRKVQQSWPAQVGGSYHFTLTHVNGSEQAPDKVSVAHVGVVY